MSTHDMAEPRCGVPAACDISMSLRRKRRAIKSRSALMVVDAVVI